MLSNCHEDFTCVANYHILTYIVRVCVAYEFPYADLFETYVLNRRLLCAR